MPRAVKTTTKTKKEEIAQTNLDSGIFNKDCFVKTYPHVSCDGDGVPMWWKVAFDRGVTFKQYKKDKKRLEKEKARMEEYVRSLEQESEKYSQKLKAESEKYRLECEERDKAYKARREKEELELLAEKEQSRKRLLAEALESKNKLKEFEKNLDEEREQKRELEATRKFELKKAKIEAEEKAQREKILAEEEAEKLRLEAIRSSERKKEERRERERELKRLRLEAEMLDEEEANAEKVRLAKLEAEQKQAEEEKLSRELALLEEQSQRELAERERVRNAHREDRIKREEEEKKRAELELLAKKRTIAGLKKAHKVKDVEFVYPAPSFSSGEAVLEFSGAMLKTKKEKTPLSHPVDEVLSSGVTVTTCLTRRDMQAVCSMIRRDFSSKVIMSGGIRFEGKVDFHALTRKDYLSFKGSKFAILDYEAKKLHSLTSVKKYLCNRIGQDKLDLATDYLQRLNVRSAKNLIQKKALFCTVGETAKILLVCALLSNARLTLLCEPQRCLDMPSRSALRELVEEWQGKEEGRALWIITSDEDLYKG